MTSPFVPHKFRQNQSKISSELNNNFDEITHYLSRRNKGEIAWDKEKVIDVRTFDVKGDGVTDDTTNIQAAIDDTASTLGAVLYFPQGDYNITSTLSIPTAKKISIVGDSRRSTVFSWNGGNSDVMIHCTGSASTTADLFFEKFTLLNDNSSTSLTGIEIGESTGDDNSFTMLDFYQILFNGVATGIQVYSETDESTVRHCWFFDSTNGVLINQTSTGNNSNSNWDFYKNHFQGVTTRAVDCQDGGSRYLFLSNTVQSAVNAAKGFRVDKVDSASFISNYWENSTATASGPFIEFGPSALAANSMSGVVIIGNHLDCGVDTAGQVGIKLDYSAGAVVYANSFTNINTGISITANATDILIGPNVWGSGVTTKLSNSGANVTILDPNLTVDIAGLDHGAIEGLTDDDHSIYALLAGRSGGQSLVGGTASGDDLTLKSTSNATKGSVLFGTGTTQYDETNDDLYTTDWTDYGGSTTLVGFSSTTTKEIYYRKVGKIVYVNFGIEGTSDATNFTFTLPVANNNTQSQATMAMVRGEDNSAFLTTPSMTFLPVNSSTVQVLVDPANSTAWTGSGTKGAFGQFWYRSA